MSNQGVYWNAPSSRWDTGLRWSTEPGPKKPKTMAIIAINTSQLPIPQKLIRGQDIITKSTSNPNVPGNTVLLTAFSTQQVAFTAANAAYEANRQDARELLSARDAALEAWNGALTGLAGFTESATGGDETKILSAGFGVRAAATPPQPVSQILNVRVNFTGMPGYSEVRWKRDANADAYVVQCSPDPITETSWKNMEIVTEPKYQGNGATPGQKCWYRIAGVSRLGQGPLSEPALRPVM